MADEVENYEYSDIFLYELYESFLDCCPIDLSHCKQNLWVRLCAGHRDYDCGYGQELECRQIEALLHRGPYARQFHQSQFQEALGLNVETSLEIG